MSPDSPLSPLHDKAIREVCPETQQGWLWHCHEHDTHGNADSEEEAQLCAEAHREFWMDRTRTTSPATCGSGYVQVMSTVETFAAFLAPHGVAQERFS